MNSQEDLVLVASESRPGRILAIDLGDKRIGLAISDPLGMTAQGLPTLARRNTRQDQSFLRSVVKQYGIALIVLGNPLNMNGTEGSQSAKARQFAAQLSRRLKVEVQLWDERLTSVEAERVLKESGMRPDRTAGAVDRLAAVLLLQNFLDSRRTALSAGEE